MIQDFSSDVKKFLLSYTSIGQINSLAQDETKRIFGHLETEIARQEWFISTDFRTNTSWKWLQVWKKNWHPSHKPSIPFIHFEYTLSWSDQWVLGSLDIESLNPASHASVCPVAETLYTLLSKEKPPILKGHGWILKHQLEGNRMLLINRHSIIESEFSAEWVFSNGIEYLNQLSEIIPIVDKTIEEIFN